MHSRVKIVIQKRIVNKMTFAERKMSKVTRKKQKNNKNSMRWKITLSYQK